MFSFFKKKTPDNLPTIDSLSLDTQEIEKDTPSPHLADGNNQPAPPTPATGWLGRLRQSLTGTTTTSSASADTPDNVPTHTNADEIDDTSTHDHTTASDHAGDTETARDVCNIDISPISKQSHNEQSVQHDTACKYTVSDMDTGTPPATIQTTTHSDTPIPTPSTDIYGIDKDTPHPSATSPTHTPPAPADVSHTTTAITSASTNKPDTHTDEADSAVVPAICQEKSPIPTQSPDTQTIAADTPSTFPVPQDDATPASPSRQGWMQRLASGLRRTGQNISGVFGGTRLDDDLYEELEAALLMADAGVQATQHLLDDLKARVKAARTTDPAQVRILLADAIADLLSPLQKPLVIGQHTPTIIMVAGVNGAGKTTSIGKLTRHLAEHHQHVLLAAADTFRAAAREQLAIWADRNTVDIISSAGGDPAALAFDAVSAGRARGSDVVLVDTAGRLPTQLHLMDELKKIHRTIAKADSSAPHEVLLVIDGNTGQNALAQVKAFHAALPLTGLIVTKLDGTAKGGVLCAIAREQPVPVYFVGVGEQLHDLQTFDAREFAQAMLGLESVITRC